MKVGVHLSVSKSFGGLRGDVKPEKSLKRNGVNPRVRRRELNEDLWVASR